MTVLTVLSAVLVLVSGHKTLDDDDDDALQIPGQGHETLKDLKIH